MKRFVMTDLVWPHRYDIIFCIFAIAQPCTLLFFLYVCYLNNKRITLCNNVKQYNLFKISNTIFSKIIQSYISDTTQYSYARGRLRVCRGGLDQKLRCIFKVSLRIFMFIY